MGNNTSQNQNISSLASEVDDIALNYILTQNTIDLLRLTDKEYYDNLIILTSSVIEKKFNGLELGFLQQRIFGKQNDAIDIVPASNKLKEQVIFNISKFYVKIIMIYGAIATTIDPQYSYEVDGVKKTFYLKEMGEYKNIPKHITPELVNLTNPMNLCRKRLSILKNKLDPQYDEHTVKLNPGEQLCSLTSTTSLTDEVGIKELDLLYFDIFDYETKTWSKRSAKMKQKYNKDLTLFYQIFTGKVDMPESITSFNDIELLDLSTIDNCNRDSFKKDIYVSNDNRLVKMYQDKIKLIEQSTQIYRGKLVNLLRELFLIEEKNGVRKRIINPKLTLDHILIIENDTRDTILNLYTSCEKYFIQALILFEKIYDEQVKSLNENRVNFIENQVPPFNENEYTNENEGFDNITPDFGPNIPVPPEFSFDRRYENQPNSFERQYEGQPESPYNEPLPLEPLPSESEPEVMPQPLPTPEQAQLAQAIPTPEQTQLAQAIPTPEQTPQTLPTPEQTDQTLPTPEQAPQSLPTPEQAPQSLPTPEQTPQTLPTPEQTPQTLPTPEQTPQPLPTPEQTPQTLPTPEQTPQSLPTPEQTPVSEQPQTTPLTPEQIQTVPTPEQTQTPPPTPEQTPVSEQTQTPITSQTQPTPEQTPIVPQQTPTTSEQTPITPQSQTTPLTPEQSQTTTSTFATPQSSTVPQSSTFAPQPSTFAPQPSTVAQSSTFAPQPSTVAQSTTFAPQPSTVPQSSTFAPQSSTVAQPSTVPQSSTFDTPNKSLSNPNIPKIRNKL